MIHDMKSNFFISCRLDCSGQLCPVPILMTEEKIEHLKSGEILEVLFTDPGAEPDLKAWCKAMHHEFMGIKKEKLKGEQWMLNKLIFLFHSF